MPVRIRKRSPAEDALYQAILPRLAAGESAAKISRETGLPVNTVRSWKCRARARNPRAFESQSSAAVAIVDAPPPALDSAEKVREFLLSQGEIAGPLLRAFGESMAGGLQTAHAAMLRALEIVSNEIAETTKDVLIHDGDGSSHVEQMRKAPADTAHSIKALSVLIERFAAFHCIPHGVLKTEALRFAPAAVSNHLHLHSHGARSSAPARPLPAKDIRPVDVTPAGADRMSGNQRAMVLDTEDD